MTTRAPAVLKMNLFVFLTNLEPQGFAFPFQIQSTLHHPQKKNKFVILVIDDHVLRKRGSRVYVCCGCDSHSSLSATYRG